MRFLDSPSWQVIALWVIALWVTLGMGIWLLMMMTLRQRRERLSLSDTARGKVRPAVERLHATSAEHWSKVYAALAKQVDGLTLG